MKTVLLFLVYTSVLALTLADDSVEEFVEGNHKFTASVYKEFSKNEQGNFIVSPFSAEIVLALTNEGAKGTTSAELTKGLSLPSTKEGTQTAVKTLLPNLGKSDSDDAIKLLSANKIYVANGVKLEDDFRSIASLVYNGDAENINFRESQAAAASINKWVEDNTNNKIKDLITEDDIGASTDIVLVNTLYFKGTWTSGFYDLVTRKKSFYKTKSDVVEVDTMQKTEVYNFYNSPTLNAKFVELDFVGGDVSMVIVLPNEVEGLASLEQNLDQVLSPQPLELTRIYIALPKFSVETNIDLIPILKTLGIRKLFEDADLSGLASTENHVRVTTVKQKTFINVTEAGVEAAAATGVAEDKSTASATFQADHPFLYFIKQRKTILFIGRYTIPKV